MMFINMQDNLCPMLDYVQCLKDIQCGRSIYLLMQQRLIVTLWKAQFKDLSKQTSAYCRLTYNNQERNSKSSSWDTNFSWKESFTFTLSKKNTTLKLQFINLEEGQQIHFANDNVVQELSFGTGSVNIQVEGIKNGSWPCKAEIVNKDKQVIGKFFVQYQIEKMDYNYMLKISNFKVTFVRTLKVVPKFYLWLFLGNGREQKQTVPFEEDKNGAFIYKSAIKLFLKKEPSIQIQIHSKTQQQCSVDISDSKSKESHGKKEKLVEFGKQKIFCTMELNFEKDTKFHEKLALITYVKFQKRVIGTIEFQTEVTFKSKDQMEQSPIKRSGSPYLQRKRSFLKHSNGTIFLQTIIGKLKVPPQLIQNKNISLQIKLGKKIRQSQILHNPGDQIIIIDHFVFKRTWQQTMKLTVLVHTENNQKIPCFFSEVNLRQLFEIGQYKPKAVKIIDEQKNPAGELSLFMVYKQQQKRKSPPSSARDTGYDPSLSREQIEEIKARQKRIQIEQRMKRRQQQRARSKQFQSMSTVAVLQDAGIILPPLRSISRIQTLSPKNQKSRNALINVNGNIKFTRASRFQSFEKPGYESYTYVKQSDFDPAKKKGTYIGYGNKHDFVKPYQNNPGVGRYSIPTVWDKYNV